MGKDVRTVIEEGAILYWDGKFVPIDRVVYSVKEGKAQLSIKVISVESGLPLFNKYMVGFEFKLPVQFKEGSLRFLNFIEEFPEQISSHTSTEKRKHRPRPSLVKEQVGEQK